MRICPAFYTSVHHQKQKREINLSLSLSQFAEFASFVELLTLPKHPTQLPDQESILGQDPI